MNSSAPRLLPADPQVFYDRELELQRVTEQLDEAASAGTTALIWLTGTPGIGKTTLAVRLGHRFAEAFPDGQLYYELGGSTSAGPATATDVLAYFLRQLGKAPDEIPTHERERAAVLRSVTSTKRILMLLDDAHTAAQVQALLPSSLCSAVIVTSRRHLEGLHAAGFCRVDVAPFTADISVQVVTRSVGADWVTAEPAALDKLVAVCGGLPLALRVVATRIAARRRRPLADFVERFTTSSTLAEFRLDDDTPVEAVFDACYHDLPPDQAELYRLLGLHPGPDYGVPAVSALLGAPETQAGDLLDCLVDAYLLEPFGRDRYRQHSLIALHARERAHAGLTDEERHDAVVRVVRWYWHRAVALAKVISRRWWVGELYERIPAAYAGPDARERALAELEAEEANFRAVIHAADTLGLDEVTAGLCQALQPWYYDTDRSDDLITALRTGAVAAGQTGDQRLAMRLTHDLGSALEKLGEFDAALEQFGLAGRLAEGLQDAFGAASAVEWEGLVHEQRGKWDEALECLRAAWNIHSSLSCAEQRPRSFALLRMHIGRVLAATGRITGAVTELEQARSYFAAHDEPVNEGRSLVGLATAHRDAGHRIEAVALLGESIDRFTRAGLLSQSAKAHQLLGELERDLSHTESAAMNLQRALALFTRLGKIAEANHVDAVLDALSDGEG